jgi:hypothetical protein
MDTGVAPPVCFRTGAQQDLGHGRADQLGVGQQRRPAQPSRRPDRVIDLHVQCGQEGVEVLRHNMIIDTLPHALASTPDIGTTRLDGCIVEVSGARRTGRLQDDADESTIGP